MLSEDSVQEAKDGAEHWAIGGIRDKVKHFIDGVKDTRPQDAVNRITEVAGQAKDQATDYMDHTTGRGMADDVTGMIRRYPGRALMIGLALGLLMLRRKAG